MCRCGTTESIPQQCWYLNQDVQCEPTGTSHRRLLSSIKCSSKELRHCDTGRHGSRRLHTDEQCTRSHLQTSCCACTRNRRIPAACVHVKNTGVQNPSGRCSPLATPCREEGRQGGRQGAAPITNRHAMLLLSWQPIVPINPVPKCDSRLRMYDLPACALHCPATSAGNLP